MDFNKTSYTGYPNITYCHTYDDICNLPCVLSVTLLWRQSLYEHPSLPPTADAFTLQPFRYGISWRFSTWSNRAALCESYHHD